MGCSSIDFLTIIGTEKSGKCQILRIRQWLQPKNHTVSKCVSYSNPCRVGVRFVALSTADIILNRRGSGFSVTSMSRPIAKIHSCTSANYFSNVLKCMESAYQIAFINALLTHRASFRRARHQTDWFPDEQSSLVHRRDTKQCLIADIMDKKRKRQKSLWLTSSVRLDYLLRVVWLDSGNQDCTDSLSSMTFTESTISLDFIFKFARRHL